MNVYVTSAYPTIEQYQNIASSWLQESAQGDIFHLHHITDDPDTADVILFVEHHPGSDLFVERAINHPLRRRYPDKAFLYHDADYAFPFMPGIYPSIKKPYYNSVLCRSGTYIARLAENEAIIYNPKLDSSEILFSFVGANNCTARSNILSLVSSNTYLKDTTGDHAWLLSAEERKIYEQNYVDVLRRSEFILCPRGIGPSTYRLYEAMEMGKCPVIISDDWVEPPFIPWSDFSIRVPEADYAKLPEILHSISGNGMGVIARKAWETYVAKPVCFHWMVESCISIMKERRGSRTSGVFSQYLRFAQSEYFPNFYMRAKARNLKHHFMPLSNR